MLSFTISTAISFSQDSASAPNVLFIIADDLGIDAFNSLDYGIDITSQPSTPTLDMLKAHGISYLNVWATPQCTPTRASLMSGKYGIINGVRDVPDNLDLEHESIFNYLNDNLTEAYAKAVVGKWHISNPINVNHPFEHGVDHYEGIITGVVDNYYSWTKVDDTGQTQVIDEYVTQNLTNAAKDWIANQTTPWFMWLAHIAPHSPFHIPPAGTHGQTDFTNNRQRYLAAIESMDYYIGDLLNSLDQETRDNTLVIVIGDNGTPNGVARFFPEGHSKSSMYEGGLRVPMLISGQGVTRQGELETGLVQVNDIYATIIDVLSNDITDVALYNSVSLAQSFTTQNTITRPYIYSDYIEDGAESWAIREATYKLIEDQNGREELYNVVTDLEELNNLVGNLTPQQAVVLDELKMEAQAIRNGNTLGVAAANQENNISILPNPTSSIFKINTTQTFPFTASLYNLQGKKLIEMENTPEEISVETLATGVYLLEIQNTSDNSSHVFKVIKS